MISLTDYVGTDSKVGRKNNIWSKTIFYFSNVGEGFFDQLSPDRVAFRGYMSRLVGVEALNFDVRLLNDKYCDVIFQSHTYRNVPYFVEENSFVADIPIGFTLRLTRYKEIETELNLYTFGQIEPPIYGTYHIQPI